MGRPKLFEHCTVDGCGRDHYSRSFCQKHYTRFRVHGDPSIVKARNKFPKGPAHPSWKNRVGYTGAHERVRRDRGPASEHLCTACEAPASDWALRHEAQGTLLGTTRGRPAPYSLYPADYQPMCRPCHTAYDSTRR